MSDVLSPFRVGSSLSSGTTISKVVWGTFTLNPASIGADTITSETITAPGAEVGMIAFCLPKDATAAEPYSIVAADVTAADTITLKLGNMAAGANDPGSQTWQYLCIK